MMKLVIAAAFGVGEIVLIVACALIVVSAIVTAIIRRVQGKLFCGGDCCNCCANCVTKKKHK